MSNDREDSLKHENVTESFSVVRTLSSLRVALAHINIPEVFLFMSKSNMES